MKDFRGKVAVVTGAGTGMGRELARQLAAEGCHVALCDLFPENLAETARLCAAETPASTRVTTHECDVSDEVQVFRFRDAVLAAHGTDHVNLLFNNAGIGGGGSFVVDDRGEWERTFGVDWFGVYYCARAFVPLLVAAEEAAIVNTSSVNGFWASLGPALPHTAYAAAKFAVKGFTEALITDFAVNAPHVSAHVVMPGHIGTSIAFNTRRVLSGGDAELMTAAELERVRARLGRQGMPDAAALSDNDVRAFVRQMAEGFRDNAPTTAAQAAATILGAVREGRWRILVGEDAAALDRLVRAVPESAYAADFLTRMQGEGNFGGILSGGPDGQRT
jgi:NAD(P)-dependent dehydrogenase (short-subunit alcohol dehydrogenase family)